MDLFVCWAIILLGVSIWVLVLGLISCGASIVYAILPQNGKLTILQLVAWILLLIYFSYKLVVSGMLFYDKILTLLN